MEQALRQTPDVNPTPPVRDLGLELGAQLLGLARGAAPALQVAARLLDGPGDRVWLVELATLAGQDAVTPAVCRALGIAAQPGRPTLDTLLDALAPQAVLIVLDNCEHLVGDCAVTAEAIVRRYPRVHLLATSREPLGVGGEAIYRLARLSLPGPGESGVLAAESSDAVALFIERARAQGTGLSVDEQTAPPAGPSLRYRLLETIRQFARAAVGDEQVQRATPAA
jgi:predicted ATPase